MTENQLKWLEQHHVDVKDVKEKENGFYVIILSSTGQQYEIEIPK